MALLSKGAMGPGIFRTGDCRKTAKELKDRGVRVHAGARRALLWHRCRLPGPLGNEWRLVQPIEYDVEALQGVRSNGG